MLRNAGALWQSHQRSLCNMESSRGVHIDNKDKQGILGVVVASQGREGCNSVWIRADASNQRVKLNPVDNVEL